MDKKIRIAVLVSGGGTNLQAIIDAVSGGIISHGEIALVVSNKENAYALTRARNSNIPTKTVLKKDFESRELFEEEIINTLQGYGIDLIVLAGFMYILSKKFISEFENRIINVHPSLIPSFCGEGFYGLRVHEAALKKGVKVTGATVHFVNEIPDGGEIIMQKAVNVEEGDTPEILQRRVMEEAEWKILPLSIEKICQSLLGGKQ